MFANLPFRRELHVEIRKMQFWNVREKEIPKGDAEICFSVQGEAVLAVLRSPGTPAVRLHCPRYD